MTRLSALLVGLAPGVDDSQLELERERRVQSVPRLYLARLERLEPPVLSRHPAAEARLLMATTVRAGARARVRVGARARARARVRVRVRVRVRARG